MIMAVLRHLRPRRRVGWLWVVLTVGTVLNGLRLRGRLQALARVESDGEPIAGSVDPDHVFVTAAGVRLDEATRVAASRHARRHELDVLDLVPGDLRAEHALDLVRLVDPATYASNRLAPGRGPGQATLVHRSVLERAGVEDVDDLDPVAYLHLTAELKRFAAKTTDVAIADGLRSVREDPSQRRAYLSALYSKAMPVVVATPVVHYGLLGVGLLAAPGWGAAALAAYCVQPYVALGGTAIRPPDLTPLGLLTRPLRAARRTARTITGQWQPPPRPETTPDAEQLQADYDELLADGIDRFFEPRRDTCPLCGGSSLTARVRVGDLLQFKPGEFELDECADCAHVFQNPRLSLAGLDFYYRDFYDGMGGEQLEFVFASDDTSYRGRVDLVAAHARPKRWLDVGGGHGHFCLIASDLLPDTRFDGLDLSEGIVGAERRQWIEQSFVGLFPELADDLRGAYDVVSMHHYLEHTREPADELDAAAKVLEPGGHLLIEVPDPECTYGRAFGWLWGPWFQPQHQHFVSVANLSTLLDERGFRVVAVERGPAHQPVDLAFALLLLTNRLAGPPARPWREPPPRRARLRRGACFAVLAPFMVLALVVDRVIAPIISGRPGGSNTYRLLAQKSTAAAN